MVNHGTSVLRTVACNSAVVVAVWRADETCEDVVVLVTVELEKAPRYRAGVGPASGLQLRLQLLT